MRVSEPESALTGTSERVEIRILIYDHGVFGAAEDIHTSRLQARNFLRSEYSSDALSESELSVCARSPRKHTLVLEHRQRVRVAACDVRYLDRNVHLMRYGDRHGRKERRDAFWFLELALGVLYPFPACLDLQKPALWFDLPYQKRFATLSLSEGDLDLGSRRERRFSLRICGRLLNARELSVRRIAPHEEIPTC